LNDELGRGPARLNLGYVCRKGETVNHWLGVIDGLVKLGAVSAEGQALQALEREGLLRVEYGGVTILNLEGLRQR
jgi:hypothetical protein